MVNFEPQNARMGMTRSSYRQASLHKHAKDKRAEPQTKEETQKTREKSPLKRASSDVERDINASPISDPISESELSEESPLKKARRDTVKQKARAPRWTNGVKQDENKSEAIHQGHKQRNRNTYGKPVNNIHAPTMSKKKAAIPAQTSRKGLTSRRDDSGFIEPKSRSLSLAKESKDTESGFVYPSNVTKTADALQRGNSIEESNGFKVYVAKSSQEASSKKDSQLENNNKKRDTVSANKTREQRPRSTRKSDTTTEKSESSLDVDKSFQLPKISDLAKQDLDKEASQDALGHTYRAFIDLDSGGTTPLSSSYSVTPPSEPSRSDPPEPASSNTSATSFTSLSEDAIVECPICSVRVDQEQVAAFRSRLCIPESRRLNIRQQASFHRDHIIHSAEAIWQERNYPPISWFGMSDRLKAHEDHIASIISGTTPSYYRSALHTAPGAGHKTRTWAGELARGHDGAEGVGYYGSRGQKAFGLWAVERFSGRLRERQHLDPDIAAAGGVSGFIQKVLVPEIAQELIREDLERCPEMGDGVRDRAMERARRKEQEARDKGRSANMDWSAFAKVGEEEKAWTVRWIAEESAECGRLLSEEEDDVVDVLSEDEADTIVI